MSATLIGWVEVGDTRSVFNMTDLDTKVYKLFIWQVPCVMR